MKGEKDKIGPTARRMKENNKNQEYTVIPGIAAHCARSHSLRIFQHTPSSEAMCPRALPETKKISKNEGIKIKRKGTPSNQLNQEMSQK